MSAAVRWVRVRDKEEPALVIDCVKFANVILMDFPIQVYTYGKKEASRFREVMHKGEPYPVKRNIEQYIRDSSFHGITPGARRIMMEYLAGKSEIEDCRPSENNASEENKAQKAAFDEAYADPRADDMDSPVPKPVRAAPTGRTLYKTGGDTAESPERKPQRIPRPSDGQKRGNVVQQLAEKLGITDTAEIRKRLRKAGLRQPYGSLEECLKAIS